MAFTKNPLQDGTKTKLSDYSNDLENRVDIGFRAKPSYLLVTNAPNVIAGGIYVHKFPNGLVIIEGRTVAMSQGANATLVATVPEAYRPNAHVAIPVYNQSRGTVANGLVLGSNGNIYIRSQDIQNGNTISFQYAYLV